MSFYQTGATPKGYVCDECGKTHVKLWREYQTFLNHQVLRCGDCALRNQNKEGPINQEGKRLDKLGMMTDQIGWLVPAVPTEENDTFWGYTSVPPEGCKWWRELPTE